MKRYLSIVTIAFLISACNKTSQTPVACFTQSKSTVSVNESIQFSNCSSNIGSVKWDFGDGSGSTENAPSHSYTVAGTFTVKLTVYSPNGANINESTASITVNGGNGNTTTNPGSFTRFYITKVEILGFPNVKVNGDQWDIGSGSEPTSPDMYAAIASAGTSLQYGAVAFYEDKGHCFYNNTNISQLKWDYSNNPILVNFPSSGGFSVDVYLFDVDYGSYWFDQELMAKIPSVDFFNSTNYGQSTVTFTQASYSVKFTLTWQ